MADRQFLQDLKPGPLGLQGPPGPERPQRPHRRALGCVTVPPHLSRCSCGAIRLCNLEEWVRPSMVPREVTPPLGGPALPRSSPSAEIRRSMAYRERCSGYFGDLSDLLPAARPSRVPAAQAFWWSAAGGEALRGEHSCSRMFRAARTNVRRYRTHCQTLFAGWYANSDMQR